jgi:hypothetical protein
LNDPRIFRVLGGPSPASDLLEAAYADSTWDRLCCTLNNFEKFEEDVKMKFAWPLNDNAIAYFIKWSVFVKKHALNTTSAYIANLKLIHRLRNLDFSACNSFSSKTQLKGAENLNYYNSSRSGNKKVMTLPLLKVIGHELSLLPWTDLSKSVTWTAMLCAFYGSFRFGELVPKNSSIFNEAENLLWSDIKFVDSDSVIIHNKIPKTRNPNGEFISLFRFPDEAYCPINALLNLKKLSKVSGCEKIPVFSFGKNNYLTIRKVNEVLFFTLSRNIGSEASAYSCKSFRAALPSALSSNPKLENDINVKRWGRWHSNAYERYTRLNHRAKGKLFQKFAKALDYT